VDSNILKTNLLGHLYSGGSGEHPQQKELTPKIASEASKWANLNLQTQFGAFFAFKTPV
jgi:hypothetical protein